MTPLRYVPELHYEQVRAWMQARGDEMPPDLLPPTGFFVPGKAACFMYRTDSSMVLVEGLVAAPGLEREERSQALDAVIIACCEEAKRLGYKLAMAYTQLDSVVKRVERMGWTHAGSNNHLIVLPL
jgi:hypothetical protein